MTDSPDLISINDIRPNPYQVRQVEDPVAVQELAANIEKNTLLQPPTVRVLPGTKAALRYQLAFGHTRLAAFKFLVDQGKKEFSAIPCFVKDLDDLQMFEMAVAENIKRRDLNPIERARAMQTYMETFKKTSAETGEFFNCDEATVRGAVRLLGLPQPAQEKIADGEISVGVARSLLSLAKIAPQEVDKAVEDILKKDDDPVETIKYALNSADEVHEMYQDHNKKNPTAGRGLWELNQKKFPNNLLPELTLEDAVIALGIQDDETLMATTKVWLENGQLGNFAALGLDPDLVERMNRLLNPPACTACPVYTVINGDHYCGSKICLKRKMIAWRRQLLSKKSKEMGIPAYTEADGDMLVLSYNTNDYWKNQDKGLRLIQEADIKSKRSYYGQYFTNLPDGIIAVLTGASLEKIKAKKTEQRREVIATNKEARSAEKEFRRTKKDRELLVWDAAFSFLALFDGIPGRGVEALWKQITDIDFLLRTPHGIDKSEIAQRQLLGLNLINETLGDETMNGNVTALAEEILVLASEWNVTLPADYLERAQSIQPKPAAEEEPANEGKEDEPRVEEDEEEIEPGEENEEEDEAEE